MRLLLAVSLWVAPPVGAQSTCTQLNTASCTIAVDATVSLPHAATLTVSSPTTSVGQVTASVIQAGTQSVAGPTVTARANFAFTLQLASVESQWAYTGSFADPSKPVGDLEWRTTSLPWQPIGRSQAALVAGVLPGSTETTRTLEFRVQWRWGDTPPGYYAMPIQITLVAP